MKQVARAARSAAPQPSGPEPLPHSQLLIGGLAVRLADGVARLAHVLDVLLLANRFFRNSHDVLKQDFVEVHQVELALACRDCRQHRTGGARDRPTPRWCWRGSPRVWA